jgi:DNA-binding XRE family transcriptional regulator
MQRPLVVDVMMTEVKSLVKPHKKDLVRYIYALIDPRDDAVRYVGCAGDIDERLRQHMRSKNLSLPKYRWLAELKQCGFSPRLEILETVEGYLPTFAREEYWVKKLMRSGAPLTNVLLTREIPLERKKKATRPTSNRILRRRGAVVQELFSDKMSDTGLKRIRESLGLTEEGMVKRLTVSYSTYRNAERGKPCRYATAMEILGVVNGIRAERGMAPVSLEDLGLNIQ